MNGAEGYMLKEKLHCFMCNNLKDTGIIVNNHFICIRCERKIVNTSPNHQKYQSIKEKIKLLWAK
ncbi:hypothetical protein F8153_03550 [Alkaliphilus serpentinus]|uniref:Inhibitor of sigma-G Gin n=1 Tax=Alkaliphilus serpentinus TaxID=1482731 RepID=A0A833HQE7_9FIRM|nr:hypothetical protein F8153_03550 [Alkaliphilus serpentinus]